MKVEATLKLDGAYLLIEGLGPAIAGDILSFEKDFGEVLTELQQITGMPKDQLKETLLPKSLTPGFLNGQMDAKVIAKKADGTVLSIDANYPLIQVNAIMASRVEKLQQEEE